jgi:hypothetical protein
MYLSRNPALDEPKAELVPEPDFLELQETPAERTWREHLNILAEGNQISTSKAEHDLRFIVSTARLYACHEGSWLNFLQTKGLIGG